MFNGKKISVALCSYNGALYIEEQLNSILEQTVIPDEIVISDDGSKDDTLKIIDKISKSEKAKGVEFKIHTDNPIKGWRHNFEWILNFVTGDYIFNCDQDDVWMPTKVEEVISTFIAHPDALMVIHDFQIVDKNLDNLNIEDFPLMNYKKDYEGLGVSLEKGKVVQLSQEKVLLRSAITNINNGMAICFKKELLPKILPFPKRTIFDKWEVFCALCCGEVYFINKNLTLYRQHGNNITSVCGKKYTLRTMLLRLKHREANLVFVLTSEYTKQLKLLEENSLKNTEAYKLCLSLSEYERKRAKAVKNGRFIGFFRWIKMYLTDKELRTVLHLKSFLFSLMQLMFGKIDKIPEGLL